MLFAKLPLRKRLFYKEVARMVRRINTNKATVKAEVYRTPSPLRYYPLLHRVVLNYALLEGLAQRVELSRDGAEIGAILACEILTNNLRNDGFRRKLKSELGASKLKDVEKKVFVRLNTLKATEEDLGEYNALQTCIPNVFQLLDAPGASCENGCQSHTAENTANSTSPKKSLKQFYSDQELQGKIKIQNLCSCLPAFVLDPPQGARVIDATAAPGNKTTHLCSIMNNTGQIYAFEKSAERFAILEDQLEKYGATNVAAKNMDFLRVSPAEYGADYVLVDPSCSGSGIHLNYAKDQKRVDGLHNIQAMLLNHAFKFAPKRVVFSTCSVHAEEGEEVVKEALEKNPGYVIGRIGDFWEERGYPGYEFSSDVIRSLRNDDGTVGFFVALFVRKDAADGQ